MVTALAQADTDDGKGDGLTSDDRKELAALRKEKRRLEVENEILRPGRRPRRWPAGASCSAAPLAVEKLARDAHLLADLVRDAILSHGEAVRGPKVRAVERRAARDGGIQQPTHQCHQLRQRFLQGVDPAAGESLRAHLDVLEVERSEASRRARSLIKHSRRDIDQLVEHPVDLL